MSKKINECIEALIKLEPALRRAGNLALQMRSTTLAHNKYQSGFEDVDIVTEADLAVQEAILSELAKTKLADCQIIAEEDTPSVAKFKGTNKLVLTLDPINGTMFYATNKRFFSLVIYLHNKKSLLYSFYYYPVFDWTRRITKNKIEDFGNLPQINIKNNIDLSKTIVYTFGEPEKTIPKLYSKLTAKGYTFRHPLEVTDESGSSTLFYLNQVGGYFISSPAAYDGIGILYYGKVKKYKIYSKINISKPITGSHGQYYPGWYVVLKK